MAINFRINNPINGRTSQVTVDFQANLLVDPSNYNSELDYYFKFQTSGADTEGDRISPRVVTSLSQLAVTGPGGNSQSIDEGNGSPYTSIKEMVEDFVFDIMNGHGADHGSTGSEQTFPLDLGQD